jgi:membrane fusion protein
MSSTPLFRWQASEHQASRLHGSVLLRQPISMTVLTVLFSIIAALLVGFFFRAGFARKERVAGWLMPDLGLIQATAQQAGIVGACRVREGQLVGAGEVLFVVSAERSTARGETQQAVTTSLRARLDSLRAEQRRIALHAKLRLAALRRRSADLLAQLRELDAEIKLQQKRRAVADELDRRFNKLAGPRYVSVLDAKQRTVAALEERISTHQLARSREGLRGEIARVEAERQQLPLQVEGDTAALGRQRAELEESLARSESLRETLVRAPSAGRVTSIGARPGQPVTGGQALATLLPSDAVLETVLFAPSRAVGFVRRGTAVMVRVEAFPFERFGQFRGLVREVSRSPVLPAELPSKLAADGPYFRVRVRLVDTRPGLELKPGMRAEATLILEHRKLYEWVFSPFAKLGA